jgi:hypothetical protein
VEVKDWGAESWNFDLARGGVLEQLRRHNEGIPGIMAGMSGTRALTDRVLMVHRGGFDAMDPDKRATLLSALRDLGWTIDFLPGDDRYGLQHLIDALRLAP